MSCDERTRLAQEWQAATAAFAEAVAQLRLNINAPMAEFERARGIAEEARAQAEQARLALKEHTAIHGC